MTGLYSGKWVFMFRNVRPRSMPLAWMSRDARLIVLVRGMRSFAREPVIVLVAIYLHLLDFSLVQIGLFLSAGLAGSAFQLFVLIFIGDTLGRRRLLIIFTLVLALTSVLVTLTDSIPLLMAVALLGGFAVTGGAISGGVLQPLEQASVAGTVSAEKRTDLFAVMGMVSATVTALGALAVGLPALYESAFGLSELSAMKVVFITYAAVLVLCALCYTLLSPAVEASTGGRRWVNPLRLPSRRRIFTLSGLFSIDHFSGGFVSHSLISFWFFTKFGVEIETIGFLFFGSSLVAAASFWVAARVASRIGLINTIVFSHIPSNLLLIAMPLPSHTSRSWRLSGWSAASSPG